MRAVNKGTSNKKYNRYQEARNDLAKQIGWFCSYCEMAVSNMIEVEHVVPIDKGGSELDWENFLLSCKYCNTVKGAKNSSRDGYIWPDKDNSDLAFSYSETNGIEARNSQVQWEAKATIQLMGLDRNPGMQNEPTKADARWISRLQAWFISNSSYKNWNAKPTAEMAFQISLTALGTGFYSIWCKVFENEPYVLNEIRKQFAGTHFELDKDGSRLSRPNGII